MQETMFQGHTTATKSDRVASRLITIAQTILVIVFGFLPVFFVPLVTAPPAYSKTLLVIGALAAAAVLFALAILRSGELHVRASFGLLAFWVVAGVSCLAALFSGDVRDAFIGDTFGVHSAAFVVVLALVSSSIAVLQFSKASVIRLYTLITVSALLLGLFHLVRLFFGPEVLSFGIFTGQVSSLIGSWNDVALFFGLTIVLALVAVEQLPLTKWGRIILFLVTGLALVLLSVVNFFAVWVVLGVVSMVMLIYTLTKHRFRSAHPQLGLESKTESKIPVALAAVVFVVSVIFVIGGSAIGGVVSNASGISYVEVRPSFSATLDIADATLQDNAWLGIGPNKFIDAWRLYKNPALNQTIFWDSNFQAGNGYITSTLVTSGIAGAFTWLVFLGVLLFSGVRLLLRTGHADRFWYFIATSSFVASVYLWGMALLYVPTVSILMLAAVCTGIMYTAYGVLLPQRSVVVSMMQHKRAGFLLALLAVVIIVGAVSSVYFAGRHYSGLYVFNQAQAAIGNGAAIETVERLTGEAYELTGSDRFAREIANYQRARLTALLPTETPTEAEQQAFQQAAVTGVSAAQAAIDGDASEARNWQALGQIYSVLSVAGIEGSADRAIDAFDRAETLYPSSPLFPLLRAQVESRRNNLAAARIEAEESVSRKRNFTEAILFLTQLDIAEGKVVEAIAKSRALVTLEPQNSARYYQLGVLYAANENIPAAIEAFTEAIKLDPQYANAHYLLALALAEQGQTDQAIRELEVVLELNPNEETVLALIEQLKKGAAIPLPAEAATVEEPTTTGSDDGTITTTEDPDTSLVVPVNTVPDDGTNNDDNTSTVE